MFGVNENHNGFGTFFGTGGSGTVFSSGNTAWVSGSNGHDGMYTRCGNTVIGPNGVSTVMGSGSTKTIIGPEGVSTVMSSGNIHTVMGPNGSTNTFFGNGPLF